MTKIFVAFTLALIISHVGRSQSNFETGYVKKISGEVIRGLIDNRSWVVNPEEIIFKTSEADEKRYFKVDDLVEFGISNSLYKSAIVKVSPLARRERNEIATFEFEKKKVFLRVLIAGSKELLYFQSELEKEHFYINQGNDYELLEYKEYIKETIGNTKLVAKNRKYIGQLLIYLSGCEGAQKILSTSKYATQSLKNVFYKYYECIGEAIVRESKPAPIKKINLILGASITKVNFESEINSYNFLAQSSFDLSVNPVLGIGVDFIIPTGMQKWGVSTELLYKSYKVVWSHEVYTNPEVFQLGEYELGLSYLQLNIMGRYAIPISKQVSMIIKGGIVSGVIINETNEGNTFIKNYVDEKNERGKALDEIRSVEIGLNVGLGIDYGRFTVNWRVESTNGFSTYSGLTSPMLYNYLNLGFQLNKF